MAAADPIAVSQAAIWARDPLRSDVWRIGAVLVAVAVVVGFLTQGGDEVERAESGAVGFGLGLFAALLTGLAALGPGERMPDRAIGLRDSAPPTVALRVPLVVAGWVLAALAAVAATAIGGLGEGLGALAVGVVAPLGLAWSVHRFLERATRTQEWASARGLRWHPDGDVEERTPLLREGTYRYATNLVEGPLPGGGTATIMHLGAVTVDEHPDGSSETTRRFTVLLGSTADPGARLPLCICAPRSPVPGYDAVAAFSKKLRRIDLASAEFERRFELMIDRRGDEVWLRRLFEPTFVERLILLDPGRIGWELEGSALTVYEAGYVSGATELDRLVEVATLVQGRVEREVAETGQLAG